MSEWWTYRLHDFLLFSPSTYYRLFELYHRDLWPAQLLTMTAGIAVLVLALRRGDRHGGRAVATILGAAWLWVAWAFLLQRYATINWAAKWFAAAFVLEAVLLFWIGLIRNRLRFGSASRGAQGIGLALFVFALGFDPLIGHLAGREWWQIEIFGMTPDATVIATLGIVLLAKDRVHPSLFLVPLVWCGISGATLQAIGSHEALVAPAAGALALGAAIWKWWSFRRSAVPGPPR